LEEAMGLSQYRLRSDESPSRHDKDQTVRAAVRVKGCPTRYRTRHFFNNFTTNEDIATKFEAHYRHILLHFSHNERTPVQISLALELLKKCRVR